MAPKEQIVQRLAAVEARTQLRQMLIVLHTHLDVAIVASLE
jgi:hypothetical protein